jgi:ubiquinone/menaquinone biosynthesis C-methylase UbiE
VGVDGSARLIEIARERSERENVRVEHVCANASSLGFAAENSFDTIVAPMSLMDVEDYRGAIRETYRVLAAGGELLMSITHPCFTAPVSRWERDEARRPIVFQVDRYFDRIAWEEKIAPHFGEPVLRRHRPLEDYMAAPLAAGFTLREFREPVPNEAEMKMSPRFAKIARIPYFLFMRWSE